MLCGASSLYTTYQTQRRAKRKADSRVEQKKTSPLMRLCCSFCSSSCCALIDAIISNQSAQRIISLREPPTAPISKEGKKDSAWDPPGTMPQGYSLLSSVNQFTRDFIKAFYLDLIHLLEEMIYVLCSLVRLQVTQFLNINQMKRIMFMARNFRLCTWDLILRCVWHQIAIFLQRRTI